MKNWRFSPRENLIIYTNCYGSEKVKMISLISVIENGDDIACNQLLRGSFTREGRVSAPTQQQQQLLRNALHGPGSPNNILERDGMKRYVSMSLPRSLKLWSLRVVSELQQTWESLSVPTSVLCGKQTGIQSCQKSCRWKQSVTWRPNHLEINLFLKYDWRALNYDMDGLESLPVDFWCPDSLDRCRIMGREYSGFWG